MFAGLLLGQQLGLHVGMVVGITLATSILFHVMSREAGYRVTGLVPDRSELFLSGMHTVFTVSACICLTAALLTGWRMYSFYSSKRSLSRAKG
ncbi:hypothetical protein J2T14_002018 [Paenibacillus harenae]|nr:hypothetical protein [Paenibacillus harenae]